MGKKSFLPKKLFVFEKYIDEEGVEYRFRGGLYLTIVYLSGVILYLINLWSDLSTTGEIIIVCVYLLIAILTRILLPLKKLDS